MGKLFFTARLLTTPFECRTDVCNSECCCTGAVYFPQFLQDEIRKVMRAGNLFEHDKAIATADGICPFLFFPKRGGKWCKLQKRNLKPSECWSFPMQITVCGQDAITFDLYSEYMMQQFGLEKCLLYNKLRDMPPAYIGLKNSIRHFIGGKRYEDLCRQGECFNSRTICTGSRSGVWLE